MVARCGWFAALAGFYTPMTVDDVTILVEAPHQLLVNKLCALLSRSELRDPIDIRALMESGVDLSRALRDCPGQDAGFSPMTFAWGAQGLQVRRVAAVQGWVRAGDRWTRANPPAPGRTRHGRGAS